MIATRLMAIVAALLFGTSLLFFPVLVFVSAMLFDAPGSENNPLMWIAFVATYVHALAALIGIVANITIALSPRVKPFVISNAICLAPMAIGFLAMLLSQVLCGGSVC